MARAFPWAPHPRRQGITLVDSVYRDCSASLILP